MAKSGCDRYPIKESQLSIAAKGLVDDLDLVFIKFT